ncbi:hypothetical protein [Alteribacillus sp. HJP-4]|uniref:hypothetical protein n=1 Tax=Alteribacillus sp. HJP-4 TaxID=2775394 RepID=UPI0035CCD2C2
MEGISRKILLLIMTVLGAVALAACGGEEEAGMTVQDEEWKEINLAGNDHPTVLFHFTGVD